MGDRPNGTVAECRLGNRIQGFTPKVFARKVFCQCAALRAASLGGLSFHCSFLKRLEDLLGAHLAQKV
jgi:hypothetical protein